MNHLNAQVHPGAVIGQGVRIESFATIQEDVCIGDGTWIGPHATILSGSRIGKNCRIFPGAVVGGASQDRKPASGPTYLFVGDNTTLREFVTLNRGTLGNTIVGANVLLMAYVHVAHDCFIGDHVTVANATQLAGHVLLEHHAVVGGMVAIHQFIRVGAYSMVASKSIVRKDVPPFVKVAREPLRYCGINAVALQRQGFSQTQCNAIQETYRLIYQSNQPLPLVLEAVEERIPFGIERNEILSFIRKSSKGIVKKTIIDR
ncbi:MAG TPA: acyl-ACP--UDP-N-acetylglucosamine O-acyltransferase [Amoebophilaceae bacterium]|jgi:UDP-N-acetylglucosamine acyltransferase|nr:acyl-ACP--UDP-N-acetylglucosamine O-acyltransferase [Amoebophilaceae bacterium]